MKHRPSEFCEAGVTLVELMIGLAVASIIIIAGFTVLTTTDKSTKANEQTAATQQNARLAMELIARDVKLAGFRMPLTPNVPVGGTAGNCAPSGTSSAIRPVDKISTASVAPNDDGPDTISLIVPRTNPGWKLSQGVPVSPSSSFSAINLSATAVTEMQGEGMADSSGAYISIGGVVTAQVTTASGGTINLSPAQTLPVTFPQNTQVYLLQCITYSIGQDAAVCDTTGPCLLRTVDTGTAQPTTTNIVDGVEDIQFALGCDGCNAAIKSGVPDGVIDDWNSNNTFDAADWQTNRVWAPLTFDPATIRLVQVNVVARQTTRDQGLGEAQQGGVLTAAPLTISDHLHSADAGYALSTYQQFRRRVLTRTVAARNVEQ
ncbi:putative Type IV pilus assembly protein PilW [Nitrospira sp. KM1]|uniref:PilW family protein n=1 Tax=Nitrospira sp. KM1 TaxID=1936990 RepID=UPI0013A7AFD3|nr:PilW family protein [Nitrospira sp. KM1]BCA54974.1 putative Type IV pilus assembly protein PilW [Nitrospira sp. KM1]